MKNKRPQTKHQFPHSVEASSPLRRSLATFHGRDHSYIELHQALMRDHDAWAPSPPHRVRRLAINHYTDLAAMLEELRTRCFLADVDEKLHPDVRAAAARLYRLPLEQRKGLVFKVLLPVPDEMKVGWKGEQGEEFRTLMKDVRI